MSGRICTKCKAWKDASQFGAGRNLTGLCPSCNACKVKNGTMHKCEHCGRLFASYRKSANRYCSTFCAVPAMKIRAAKGELPKWVKKSRTCKYCWKQYFPKHNNRQKTFCSQECNNKWNSHEGFVHQSAKASDGVLEWLERRTECKYCHGIFWREYKGRRRSYCSQACATRSKGLVPLKRICRQCGDTISVNDTSARARGRMFCDTCLQTRNSQLHKEYKRRRRAQKKLSESMFVHRVDHLQVFYRDNFMCHICGESTNPMEHYLHPQYPTVDHVIPLAKGGSHTMDNCRCACRQCNAVKSDKIIVRDKVTTPVVGGIKSLQL